MKYPHVLALTCTCGRHEYIERSLAMFLDQDYLGEHTMLIFNNSDSLQSLGDLGDIPKNKHVFLVNSSNNSVTGLPYTSLGEIYNDALRFVPEYIEVIYHHDDDDGFLPSHITEGVKGLKRCGKAAYKPRMSWYRSYQGVQLMNNTLEPSIFIKASHLKKYGYKEGSSVAHHLEWVNPLVQVGDICSEEGAPATLVYNWGMDLPIFKTSGAGDTPQNFGNYRNFSQSHGDFIISPAPKQAYAHLFKGIKDYVVQH